LKDIKDRFEVAKKSKTRRRILPIDGGGNQTNARKEQKPTTKQMSLCGMRPKQAKTLGGPRDPHTEIPAEEGI